MTIGELWRRAAYIVSGSRASDDLREEMQLHIDLRAEANRRAGVSDAQAEIDARRRFGNQSAVRATARDAWGFAGTEQAMRDLRHAFRRLRQRPGFSFAVIGVLALGIGATTAMFSAVDAAMLRPLPFPNAGELVALNDVEVPVDFGPGSPNVKTQADHTILISDVEALHDVFSHIAAYATGGLNVADPDHPQRIKGAMVSSDFFATMGVAPTVGRAFAGLEVAPNGPNVVILSYGLWQRLYAGHDPLGAAVQLGTGLYTVIGVMPRGFTFPDESDVWLPMPVPIVSERLSLFPNVFGSPVIARVAPGVDPRLASVRLLALWDRMAAAEPAIDGKARPGAQRAEEMHRTGAFTPLQRDLVGTQRTALLVLLGATGLLLLIACANVTNLLLAHAAARRHEIAVRAVLGASRLRVIQQLLTESVVLASIGAALGVALAPALLGAARVLIPAQLAGIAPAQIDVRVLAFATLLAGITGVGFGLWPAIGITGESPAETIKTGGRTATSRSATVGRRILAGAELALTVILLVGSGLMLRSFQRVMSLDTGMETHRVGTLEMVMPHSAGDRAHRLQKIDDIVTRISAMPGVSAVGAVNELPMRVANRIAVYITARGTPNPNPKRGGSAVRSLLASPGYFDAMGIPLKRGRLFTASDDSLAPRVAIINEKMAKEFWGDADPVGRTFTAMDTTPLTVIGIVADVRESLRGSRMETFAQMYTPITERTPESIAIVARGPLGAAQLLARMSEAVRAVDRSQAIYNVKMMDEIVSNSLAPRRANTLLVSIFAIIALVLSAIGVYAVVSHGVAQRTRELGIRTALGATGRDLLSLVARDMAWVTATGLAVGICGAWALAHVLESLLYSVTAHDTATFVVVPIVLAFAAAVATLVPARRATRVNPADVMRAD
jgi:putative ABC transport system permease protein